MLRARPPAWGEWDGCRTSQPVYGPLLELLERDVGGRGVGVEVEAMGILGVLVQWRRELLLAMVDDIAALGVDSVVVLPEHFARRAGCRATPEAGIGDGATWEVVRACGDALAVRETRLDAFWRSVVHWLDEGALRRFVWRSPSAPQVS